MRITRRKCGPTPYERPHTNRSSHSNIKKYTAGESVPLTFHIQAPHTGTANVSIIDLSTTNGKVIAANLKQWDVYASNSVPTVTSQENFSIKMPTNLGSKCAAKGACAIQMHWNAATINQTYQSCIDFTMPAAAAKRDMGLWESVFGGVHARDFSPRGEDAE